MTLSNAPMFRIGDLVTPRLDVQGCIFGGSYSPSFKRAVGYVMEYTVLSNNIAVRADWHSSPDALTWCHPSELMLAPDAQARYIAILNPRAKYSYFNSLKQAQLVVESCPDSKSYVIFKTATKLRGDDAQDT